MTKRISAIDEILKHLQKGQKIDPDLLAQGLAEFDRIKSVITNTREMRAAQKRYYKHFAQEDLVQSKTMEKETDKALENLWNYTEPNPQLALFITDGSNE